jgi:DNA-binding winged helix-turn-helix (wHTH) protein/tetratricopeptide (TPR) repeat protein
MAVKKQGKYRFNDFEIDLARRVLRRENQAIAISTKTFDLLVFFALNPQRVVTNEELTDALWPGAQADESNLGQHIFLLRMALTGDQSRGKPGNKLIVTVPGQGYRFTATVTTEIPESVSSPMPDRISDRAIDSGLDPMFDSIQDPGRGSNQRFILSTPTGGMRKRHDEPTPDLETAEDVSQQPSSGAYRFIRSRVTQIAAVALLILIVVGAWSWLHRSRAESLNVVVADFENSTGDPAFDQALGTALSVALRQSPYLSVASRGQVGSASVRPASPSLLNAGSPVTNSAARAVCQRLHDQAYLTSDIHTFAEKYLVTVRALDCATGSSLASSKGIADTPDGVVDVLDRVAADLRRQLGESSQSIARFDKPLFAGRAASLEALRAHAVAGRLAYEGKLEDSRTLYERAIVLDPRLAIAHAELGVVYSDLGEGNLAAASLTRAYELRSTVDEANRFAIVAAYNDIVTRDIPASLANDHEWSLEYPRDPIPLIDLADLEIQIGKPGLALEPARRALLLNPDDGSAYAVLARAEMHASQFEEAIHTCNQAIGRNVDNAAIHGFLMQVAFLRLDQPAIDRQIAWARNHEANEAADTEANRVPEAFAQFEEARMDFALGKVKAAEALLRIPMRPPGTQGSGRVIGILGSVARADAELGYLQVARSKLAGLPDESDSADIPVAWAEVGETAHAKAILRGELNAHPSYTLLREYVGPQIEAAIALDQHDPDAAIAVLEPALTYDLRLFAAPLMRGQAYLAAGQQPEQAEAEFHKILDHPGIEPFSYQYALAQLGLARALVQEDKAVEAGFAYKVVLQIWKDADPDLPRLREARAEYARLTGTSIKPISRPASRPSTKSRR